VVVASLDGLGRQLLAILTRLEHLTERGNKIHSLKEGIDPDTSPAG
jgi:DNA invertase Pin-like site-specific DNA recombinase